MSVTKYSLKKDGNVVISPNFKVKEFKCNDGSDTIYIDSVTVQYLQCARNLVAVPITINSAYRTVSYNKKIGGSSSSYHCTGQACDVTCKLGALVLARIFELCGAYGIGYYPYSPFCHVDSRPKSKKYWWTIKTYGGAYNTTTSFCGKEILKKVQKCLNDASTASKNSGSKLYMNYNCGTVDGIIGVKTISAFIWFCEHANDSWKAKMLTILK